MKQRKPSGLFVIGMAGAIVAALAVVMVATTSSPTFAMGDPLLAARNMLDDGRIAEAKEIYQALASRNPADAEAVKGLAMCAREAGDDDGAVPLWERYTALRPKDANGHRQLALACKRAGRDFEALSAAQTAMSLAPDGDAAMSDLVSGLLMNPRHGMEAKDPLAGLVPGSPGTSRGWNGPDRWGGGAMPGPKIPDPSVHFPRKPREQ